MQIKNSINAKDETAVSAYESAAQLEYADRAEEYAARDERKWEKPTATSQALASVVNQFEPHRILELGVGTGRYFPFLKGERYIGVDVLEPMLNHARRREYLLRERGFSAITLVQDEVGAFLDRASTAEPFDLIFSIGCVGVHVPISTKLMESIARHLIPGGHLFIQAAQQSREVKLRRFIRHLWHKTLQRPDNYGFYCSTDPRALRVKSHSAGLKVLWIQEEDTRIWLGKPILLALLRADFSAKRD